MLEIFIILGIIVLTIFSFWPKIGLYLTIASLPLIGIDIKLANLVVPIADLIALLSLASFLINYFFTNLSRPKNERKLTWPLFFPFFLFFLISLVSVLLADNQSSSLYYFLRWPLFLYFAYIWAPANIIKDPKILKTAIIILFTSTLVVLATGYLSLWGQDWQQNFFRITTISFWGIYPFGDNHNLIAEFLNIGAFLTLIIKEFIKNTRGKRLADFTFLMMAIGIILTFSRSGWITLFLQLTIYLLYKTWNNKKERLSLILLSTLVLIVLSPLFWKMNQLQQHNVSSTQSRVLLNEITLQALDQKPLFGHGSGAFLNLVDNDIRFYAHFGPAIDAHGLLQKVSAENGLFGLLAWLFILVYLLKISWQSLKKYYPQIPWILPLCLAVAGGIFFQFFNTSYYKGKVWLPIVLFVLAVKFLEERYAQKNNRPPHSS